MRLRRHSTTSIVEVAAIDLEHPVVWDGLPTTLAPPAVITAARAGDLVTSGESLQLT